MHYDEPPKREPSADEKQQEPINNNVRTIVKASLFAAVVAGLTSVIYFTAKDNPKNFPVFMPVESQPEPPDEPVKEALQPKQ